MRESTVFRHLVERRETLSSSVRNLLDPEAEKCMVWYGMIRYGMVWYDTVWYGMVWYDTVRYGMV